MTDLSPAAQAVWEAFNQFDHAGMHVDYGIKMAAALRAAADYDPPDNPHAVYDMGWYAGMEFIQSIADELETK